MYDAYGPVFTVFVFFSNTRNLPVGFVWPLMVGMMSNGFQLEKVGASVSSYPVVFFDEVCKSRCCFLFHVVIPLIFR